MKKASFSSFFNIAAVKTDDDRFTISSSSPPIYSPQDSLLLDLNNFLLPLMIFQNQQKK